MSVSAKAFNLVPKNFGFRWMKQRCGRFAVALCLGLNGLIDLSTILQGEAAYFSHWFLLKALINPCTGAHGSLAGVRPSIGLHSSPSVTEVDASQAKATVKQDLMLKNSCHSKWFPQFFTTKISRSSREKTNNEIPKLFHCNKLCGGMLDLEFIQCWVCVVVQQRCQATIEWTTRHMKILLEPMHCWKQHQHQVNQCYEDLSLLMWAWMDHQYLWEWSIPKREDVPCHSAQQLSGWQVSTFVPQRRHVVSCTLYPSPIAQPLQHLLLQVSLC